MVANADEFKEYMGRHEELVKRWDMKIRSAVGER